MGNEQIEFAFSFLKEDLCFDAGTSFMIIN